MKRLFLLFFLLPCVVFAQHDKRGGAVTGLDEGTSLGTFTSLDAVGAGVTASLSGQVLTITIPGAGSATFTVQEGDVTLSTVVTVLDFLAADFILSESPSGEVNISIDDGGIDHGGLGGLADDDHSAYENELDNEAGLYAALSDVTNFLQTGDALAGDDITDASVDATELADNSVDSGELVDGSIDESHLNVTNSPTDNFLLSSNTAGGNFTWVVSPGAPTTADISDVSVTQDELEELETIGATTISAAQWTGLGGASTAGIALWDDADNVAQLVTLGLTATASEINTPLDGALVTLTEFRELETIGATVISASDWTAVSVLAGTNTGDEVVADLTTSGTIEIATIAETNTGTDATRAVSPDGLDGWTGSAQVTTLGTIATGVWNGTAVTYANLNFSNNIVAGDIATGAVATTEILDGTILEVDLAAVNTAVDEDILTFEATTGDYEWHTPAELSLQPLDSELTTIAALTETNGNVMFVAGGAWTSDPTPAIDGTDITNVTASHSGTITWSGTAILETGVAFQFGDASDATLTHTYANTGTNVSIAYSTAAMAVTGALTATNLSGTNTGDEGLKSKSFVIISPVASDDYPLWEAPHDITITAIHILVVGGTNLVGGLDEADSNGLNPVAIDADLTGVAGTASDDDGSLTNPTVDDGDYLFWHTTSISGTPTSLTVTWEYTID